ncbi:MAG: hypothetical protein AAF903_06035 [Pseudomonadota bacterium]
MPRRSQRGFINTQSVLRQLQTGRDGAIEVCRQAKINGPEYQAAQGVLEAIDNLAESLTGDHDTLKLKPHRAG